MAVAMRWVAWKISPSRGGNTAPPTMAITIKDPPIFGFGPNSFMPNANIVGNIRDMKLVATVRAPLTVGLSPDN
jgi:hypothetical protein